MDQEITGAGWDNENGIGTAGQLSIEIKQYKKEMKSWHSN